METGFDRVDRDIRDLRIEMGQRFVAVDQRFDRLDSTIKWFGGSIMLTILAATLAVLLGGS